MISLKKIILSYHFNKKISIHHNVKIIEIKILNCYNNYNINYINLLENLPDSIEELYIEYINLNLLSNLPSSIKKIIINIKPIIEIENKINNLLKFTKIIYKY